MMALVIELDRLLENEDKSRKRPHLVLTDSATSRR
jgi:hypothetical protein